MQIKLNKANSTDNYAMECMIYSTLQGKPIKLETYGKVDFSTLAFPCWDMLSKRFSIHTHHRIYSVDKKKLHTRSHRMFSVDTERLDILPALFQTSLIT